MESILLVIHAILAVTNCRCFNSKTEGGALGKTGGSDGMSPEVLYGYSLTEQLQ